MAIPIGIDLRQRILKAYQQENTTQQQLAQRFMVTQSFISRLLKRYQEKASLEPTPHPGKPPKIRGDDISVLENILQEKPDRTLIDN